ncbi:unnamed protein product [Psylliodes chrysocephalus]|uniref:SAM domain-containing protein n=1 Tax=Psylliodes chrysocephalus TaxID=3402493 RepID=A0A9P0D8J0_9CUCU|nr:unnamed protein product [Psylliodes chrysocephala]
MDNSESEKLEIALGSVDLLKCESDIEDEEEEIADQEDSPRRNGLFSIIENLKYHKNQFHQEKPQILETITNYGETTSPSESFEPSSLIHSTTKPLRRKRMDRNINNNGPISTPIAAPDFILHNNNHLKNERLSPGTPDTSSRSRSVTPSSASHPDTPPAQENPLLGRNYSDFMRSLAAKYNNTNPNDYFNAARNGFPPPIDPRFKQSFPNLLPLNPQNKENDVNSKRTDFSVLNPFSSVTGAAMFPPLIDMSTTQTLLAMVRTAKEAELQGLLKNVKRPDSSSPLDLSAAAPPTKRPRTKTPVASSPPGGPTATTPKRSESESPKLHEDISNWTVDDVWNFISGIDICAEYAQTFRDERIDGAGLPLLTEDHLTNTMNMKLGPALKLRSILAKKLGSCSVCLHCSHCHNSSTGSPDPGNNTGNMSDSGGTS